MNKQVMAIWIIASMLLAPLAAVFTADPMQNADPGKVAEMGMFQAKKFGAHYRVPRDVDMERMLEQAKLLPATASPEERQAMIQAFRAEFVKRNPTTPNPAKLRELLKNEKEGRIALATTQSPDRPESPVKSLVVPMEFPNATEIEWCGETNTFEGPLHNEIPEPGPRDNATIRYDNSTPELYDELFFGFGEFAGAVVHHPQLGTVDLRGNTMANYYLEQSEGKFLPVGTIYPKWLQAKEAEAYYGQDSQEDCPDPGSDHNVNAAELVIEAVDAINVDNPDFPWQEYDSDSDKLVDNLTVIHAGVGQESGGGEQGDFAIWSHASIVSMDGYKVCSAGSTGCPDRDIYIYSYSMDPENVDIGVIAEEYGHAVFGLPDLYATDLQGSIAEWAIMEAGSWHGPLAGMQPAPFPLWFRWLVGWADPMEMAYNDPAAQIKIGQLSKRPVGTQFGAKIDLPPNEVTHDNPMGTGSAWWSDYGDMLNHIVWHEFDLTGAASPVFSFNSVWSIEEDWDGAFLEVSNDDGASWTALPDVDGNFQRNTLNGNNPDNDWVLTGEGEGVLSFDLSAYAGDTVWVRLLYATDMAVSQSGWWADDFSLDDGSTNLFEDDVESSQGNWNTGGWVIGPVQESFPRYYLVEWRNMSGFDRGLAYPYYTTYYDEDEWQVQRTPYSVPGMLVYLRDMTYGLDYTLDDAALMDGPSIGPKHGLLLVDSHPFPFAWDVAKDSAGQNAALYGTVQSADAAFTLQETTPFTLDSRILSQSDTPEKKTFGPRPAISAFHDAFGYYPGLYLNPADDGFYFWQADASTVIPASDFYSTRITDFDNNPAFDLYGERIGLHFLGSGNPGMDGVDFGVHLKIVSQAEDGSWGLIRFWNQPYMKYHFPLIMQK